MEVLERTFYWVVWCGSCAYSLWAFSKASSSKYPLLYHGDFQDGWELLNSKQDISDTEWAFFKMWFRSHLPWIFGQLFLSQVLFRRWPQLLPLFYTISSLLFLMNTMGVIFTLECMSCIFLMYGVHKTSSRSLCYATGGLILFSMYGPYYFYIKNLAVEDEFRGFLFDVGFGWLMTRCISFCIDRINNQISPSSSLEDIFGILAYCLYLPVFFCGPLMTYDVFIEQLSQPNKKWTVQRAFSTFKECLCYLFCYMLLEFLLHFLYSSAMQYYPTLTYALDGWSLCGLGYSLPVLFYLKYRMIYGVAGFLAKIDGFLFPPPPKCISRIHLSSFQWRHFDRGLHLWLSKYISKPIIQQGNGKLHFKILSVVLAFSFVCMWHGMGEAVCVWTALCCVGVILEYLASHIVSFESFQQFSKAWPLWYRRIQGFFGAMSFMMMCISCIFFLANMEVGMTFVRRIILGFPVPFITTFFVLYCGCHVSIDLTEWETQVGSGHRKVKNDSHPSS